VALVGVLLGLAVVRGDHSGVSLCPRCGAPAAEFSYSLESEVASERPLLKIEYRLRCSVCGYRESMKASMPLYAAYRLRHLMEPAPKLLLEKMWLAHSAAVKGVEARGEGGG
jgi:hypothetical protein